MKSMTKWAYISLISKCGTAYGGNGGVLDLLEWCGKSSTATVTKEEAQRFWEMRCQDGKADEGEAERAD